MSTFPLLRLPLLAIEEVLMSMKIAELIELSKVSRRKRCLIRKCTKKKLKLCLSFFDDYGEVKVKSPNVSYSYRSGNKNVYLWVVTVDGYTPPDLTDMIKHCSILTEIFDFSRIEIRIGEVSYLSNIDELVNWLTREQLSVELFHFEKYGLSEEGLTSALNQIKTIEKLFIDVRYIPNYKHKTRSSLKELFLYGNPWKSIDEVINLNYEKLHISHSNFTNSEVDHLVNVWKAGGLPNLKHLSFDWCPIDNKTKINGMFPPIEKERKLFAFNCKWIASVFIDIEGSVEIERNDGSKAMLLVTTDYIPKFSLFVCD